MVRVIRGITHLSEIHWVQVYDIKLEAHGKYRLRRLSADRALVSGYVPWRDWRSTHHCYELSVKDLPFSFAPKGLKGK